MKLDLEYIDNWSLMFDFRLLLKTLAAVLLGQGDKIGTAPIIFTRE